MPPLSRVSVAAEQTLRRCYLSHASVGHRIRQHRPYRDTDCLTTASRIMAGVDEWSFTAVYGHDWLALAHVNSYPTTCSLC